MSSTTLEDRTFENAIEPTPEERASTIAYFREQGLDVEDATAEGSAEPEKKPETPPATVVPPADKVAEPAPVVPPEQTPAVVAPPVTAEAEIEIDPESRHDFESAKNDGEKLGRLAKKTKIINELKGTVAQKDGTIEELRRLLAEKDKSPLPAPVEPSPLAAPAKVEVKKDPEPEAIKPGEFQKPKPTQPKLADYADQDDPVEALENARTEYTEKLVEWREEKRDFDQAEKERIASESKKRDQQQSAQTQRQERINQRFEDAKRQNPDFEARVRPMKLTPTMLYLFKEGLPDGLTLAYQLTKPEHAETLKAIFDSTNLSDADKTDPDKVAEVINQAVGELAVFRASLKKNEPAKAEAAPTAAAAVPAPPEPVKPPPQTPSAAQPSAAAQPRKEEPSPEPARGRGAPTTRLEDIPLEDYDARREWRKRNGEL